MGPNPPSPGNRYLPLFTAIYRYLLAQVPKPETTESAEANVIEAAGLELWMAICQAKAPSMPCTTS
jgi:hypothetical protein